MKRNRLLIVPLLLLSFPSLAAHADEVDEYVEAEMKKRQIPGLALAVVKNGEIIKTKGYGLASVELNVRVAADSVFALASVTKQFTAAAIMILVEQGKVALDEKINRYIPNAPDTWKDITVRHLLTHTAGLKDSYWPTYRGSWLTNYTTAMNFEHASTLPLDFAPGERWQYSDQGYFLLGLIIEQVSGKRYRDFLREHIFQPLGMTSTTVIDQWDIIKNRVSGYTIRNGKLASVRTGGQEELPSAYGMMSTVKDLAKWDAAFYGEQILKQTSLQQMWAPVKLNSGFGHGYGFGWSLEEVRGHRIVGHGGITGTYIFRLPDHKLTVIVLSNLDMLSGSTPMTIAKGVAARYFPGLRVSSLSEQPDPDPQMTRKLRQVLSDIADGEANSPLLTPELNVTLNPNFRRYVAGVSALKGIKAFSFLACDDARERQIDRFGVRVTRICYYKLVEPMETRYLSFYLTADGKVAGVRSYTE